MKNNVKNCLILPEFNGIDFRFTVCSGGLIFCLIFCIIYAPGQMKGSGPGLTKPVFPYRPQLILVNIQKFIERVKKQG